MTPYSSVIAKKRAATPSSSAYYRSLTVDHTLVPAAQSDFPVLVSVTDATLKTVANGGHVQRSDGFDIGFYTDAGLGTRLKWEMESYNPTAGIVRAWVKIPTLSTLTDTVFYMGYGGTAITSDQSDTSSTWNNSFLGVYHMGDGLTLSTTSSTTSNNATNHSAVAGTGKVGGAVVCTSSHYLDCGNGMNPTAITLSAWVNGTSFTGETLFVVIARHNGTQYAYVDILNTGKIDVHFWGTSSCGYSGTGSHTLSTGTWYHVAGTYNSTAGALGYVNGALDGDAAIIGSGGPAGALDTTTATTLIGHVIPGDYYFAGNIDEVRVSSVARSATWLVTEYNNQNNPGTFMSMGGELTV
jgi:Concanavalin A-like lectin/glucanases superfamily